MPEPLVYQETPFINIAIFASGAGSNAKKIIDYFKTSALIKIKLIVCNKPLAYVLNIAGAENIAALIIEKEKFFRGDAYVPELQKNAITFIVLAGFLWKIPAAIIGAYPNRIINIHPALLPKYGGKNMYGNYVHEAVIKAGEKESGITIHYVDEQYDNGDIIFQKSVLVDENETVETLMEKIHFIEHENYAPVIEKVIREQIKHGAGIDIS